ncbi:hypothetical protein ALC57_15053, partial [Trachymyrmex cornetzi]
HPPALENMVPRRKRAYSHQYGGAAEQIFLTETGLASTERNKEPLTRTIQERAPSNMPTCCPKSYVYDGRSWFYLQTFLIKLRIYNFLKL